MTVWLAEWMSEYVQPSNPFTSKWLRHGHFLTLRACNSVTISSSDELRHPTEHKHASCFWKFTRVCCLCCVFQTLNKNEVKGTFPLRRGHAGLFKAPDIHSVTTPPTPPPRQQFIGGAETQQPSTLNISWNSRVRVCRWRNPLTDTDQISKADRFRTT